MAAPVNVKLQHPTVHLKHWPVESTDWQELNAAVGGNPDFYPLTVKAGYVLGVIHDLCESIAILLRSSPNPAILTCRLTVSLLRASIFWGDASVGSAIPVEGQGVASRPGSGGLLLTTLGNPRLLRSWLRPAQPSTP